MELDVIKSKIYEVRGQKVMLDADIAELYGVETKYLKRTVRVHQSRFPDDFMFELTKKEWESLRCNFCTSNSRRQERGGTRYMPFVFTEQGIAMLSGLINSVTAIEVNIAIMRTFVMVRQFAMDYKEFAERLKLLENQFTDIYEAIRYLLEKEKDQIVYEQRKRIGFKD